ncbi:MAG: arsenate reductase ArsC [Candidatus Marinimicrobia bacterium]|nr:arsenate reductase ArsC [Candidatus Neomarinimicrobiota bacterium]MDP7060025.1 arsenate reductase ArsC [Candidatus Neomarinimicrobiota bacterium]
MMKKVLFLCTGNSCRSQMAEGILKDLAGDRFEVFSAGTHPTRVHPAGIKVMAEWGIDISHHTSDLVDDYLDAGMDIVITVCDDANQLCPTFPGGIEHIHWSVDDPFVDWSDEKYQLEPYRQVRDTLRIRIEELLSKRD